MKELDALTEQLLAKLSEEDKRAYLLGLGFLRIDANGEPTFIPAGEIYMPVESSDPYDAPA